MLLSEEQTMIRDMARAFAQEQLAPHAADWDRDSTFPRDALVQMGELGLLGMLVPEGYDGAGVDHVAYALALEEIAAGDGSTSTIMSVHNSVACMPVYKFGDEVQKETFLKPLANDLEDLTRGLPIDASASSSDACVRTCANSR